MEQFSKSDNLSALNVYTNYNWISKKYSGSVPDYKSLEDFLKMQDIII